METKYTFGPVPSRRLGFSLGIDIIPLKTCTYNCVYCQLFQTSNHVITRESFYDKDKILKDIEKAILSFKNIDYLTFSGSGEPTLNKDLGWLIRQVKSIANIPVAVITNSTLLWHPDVRDDLIEANLVVPSLDAVTETVWKQINRPAPGLSLENILQGTKDFCQDFKGQIWLEIMLVSGINDDIDEIKKIATFANNLKINKVQINTVIRPPAEIFAKPLSIESLDIISKYFTHPVEVISTFQKIAQPANIKCSQDMIIELLARRPCKPQEMADSLGINMNELSKTIQSLVNNNKIIMNDTGYFSLSD